MKSLDQLVAESCGFDPSKAVVRAPAPDENAGLLLALADAAVAWWRSKRPKGWTVQQHAFDPAVNCYIAKEQQLAAAVSRWVNVGEGV